MWKRNRRYLWFGINTDNIKQLSKAVTESNYSDYSKHGYDILIAIHDLGLTKGSVYKIFYEYYKSLEVGLLREGLQICLIIYADGVILKNIFGKTSNL